MMDRREIMRDGTLALTAVATAHAIRSQAADRRPDVVRERVRSVGGVSIDVLRTSGRGRAIVLVHGLGQSHLAWTSTLRALGESTPIVAYDQRGHGGSSKPVGIDAYADGALWADDLHAVLTSFGGTAPVVVGWSLGGLVLTHYLARHSDAELGGVAFISAVVEGMPSLLTPLAGSLLKGLQRDSIEDRVAACPAFVDASFATSLPTAERIAMIVANASVPKAVFEAVARLPPADPGLLSRIRVPALIVHGLRDELVSPDMARRAAAAIPGARLRLYERSGHGPLVDEPMRLARDLEAFAASIGSK